MSGAGVPASVIDLVDKVKTFLAAGRVDNAEQDLRRIVEIEPDWSPGRLRLSALLSGLARHEEALSVLEPAVSANADNGLFMSTYGLTLFNLGRVDLALRALQGAIVTTPDNPAMVYNLIKTLRQTSLAPHARALFDRALKMAPAHLDILQSAIAFAQPRTKDQHVLWGEQLALKAVLLAPDNMDNLTTFIWFMARLRQIDKGGITSQWLTVLPPRDFHEYQSMAYAMFNLQQPQIAEHYTRSALVLETGGGDIWFLYARVLHALRQDEKASKILRRAAIMGPETAENVKVMKWTLSLEDFTKTFAALKSERYHEN